MKIYVGDDVRIEDILIALSTQSLTLVEDEMGNFIMRHIPDVISENPRSTGEAYEQSISRLTRRYGC